MSVFFVNSEHVQSSLGFTVGTNKARHRRSRKEMIKERSILHDGHELKIDGLSRKWVGRRRRRKKKDIIRTELLNYVYFLKKNLTTVRRVSYVIIYL